MHLAFIFSVVKKSYQSITITPGYVTLQKSISFIKPG